MFNKMTLLVLFSIIYIIGLAVIYFSKSRLKNEENKVYKTLIITNLIGLILQLLCDFVSYYSNSFNSILVDIILKTYLSYFLLFAEGILIYLLIILFEKHDKLIKYSFVAMLVIIGFMFLLPIQLYVDKANNIIYSYGASVNFVFIISSIISSLMFLLILTFRKKAQLKKIIPLFLFIFSGMLSMLLQMKHPELVISAAFESFLLFVMYFTIENPDMKMIAELNEAKLQAEKANNAKSEFLSNMSHEIRTPLNAIVGFSQALEEEDISGEAKEEVRDIVRASQSLLEIVNGILDISKIEANKIEIVNGEYDIYEILDDLVALTKARMGEKPLDFRIDFDPTIPHILYGDKTRIKQVILNLLTNSVKYTKEGYVEFKVSSVRKDDICRLIVSVEDSGIGIKKENLDKLFSKFERFDLDKNITIEGTGLGLAITKKLVELMHGKIVVQSIYGKGSRFTIAVDQKVVNKEKLEETDKVTDEIIDLTGKKILLVDDNNLNLKVASKLLEKYNASITTLTSGNDCLEKIKTNEHFDLILLDDMMPGMSGIETIKKLREMDNYNIPTIALTANAIEGVRQKYIDAGFDDYLSKPIEKRELNRVITKFLK